MVNHAPGPIYGSLFTTLCFLKVLLFLGEKERSPVPRLTKTLIPYQLMQCIFFFFSVLYAVLVKLTLYETI